MGDVSVTYANIDKAAQHLHYAPSTSFEKGIQLFTAWLMNNK
jgi:nucleoside-diphosphate-sugar epimerase